MDYELLDSGEGRKLERFGPYVLNRPCAQAVWRRTLSSGAWEGAHACFDRVEGQRWTFRESVPESWQVETGGVRLVLKATEFGHLGLFAEQCPLWEWVRSQVATLGSPRVLNLFAYSGGATLAAAQAGASVTHLDASKGMVAWARENAGVNGLEEAPIRWIVDDVMKFLQRELRRGRQYEGIILDPPSFGRGAQGQVFKIEDHIQELLHLCRQLLSPKPGFVLLSCHSAGFTPTVMEHLLSQTLTGLRGRLEKGEMLLEGKPKALAVPSGAYAHWRA